MSLWYELKTAQEHKSAALNQFDFKNEMKRTTFTSCSHDIRIINSLSLTPIPLASGNNPGLQVLGTVLTKDRFLLCSTALHAPRLFLDRHASQIFVNWSSKGTEVFFPRPLHCNACWDVAALVAISLTPYTRSFARKRESLREPEDETRPFLMLFVRLCVSEVGWKSRQKPVVYPFVTG